MRPHRRRGRVIGIVLVLVFVASAILWGPDLIHRYGDRLFSSQSCIVTIDGQSSTLTAEQTNNAAIIVATAVRRDLSIKASTIALAAALQESDLRNLNMGDRDSLGLFQQRPSQGWGTAEQVLDPHFAANSFYDALLRVEGWETMSVTDAAQAVQRSAYPNAYADHERQAVLWATALEGGAGVDAISCSLSEPTPQSGLPMLDRLAEDFGDLYSVEVVGEGPGHATVVIRGLDERHEMAVASWSIAVASGFAVESVGGQDVLWSRERASWEETSPGAAEVADGIVVVFASR